jgi:hypothetical protein
MIDCTELSLTQWRAGFVDGLTLAVFVALLLAAFLVSLALAASSERRWR